eukprot:6484459-Amphidinium_carterae.1
MQEEVARMSTEELSELLNEMEKAEAAQKEYATNQKRRIRGEQPHRCLLKNSEVFFHENLPSLPRR